MKTRHVLAIALAAAGLGAAVPVSAQDNRPPPQQYRRVYYDNHRHYRCERARHNAATRGTVIGAVGGGLLGGALGGHAGGVLLGAGAGAVAGNAVGRSQVHC